MPAPLRFAIGRTRFTNADISHTAAQWMLLAAFAHLGAAGPLGELRALAARGGWADAGEIDDPAEVARLRPGAAAAYRWAAARGLLWGLNIAPLRAARLARWAWRWHLGAPWLMRAALDLLRAWQASPAAAEALDVTPALRPAAYFVPVVQVRVDLVTGSIASAVEIPPGWEARSALRDRQLPLAKRFEVFVRYQCLGTSVRRLAAELRVDRAALRRHLCSLAEAAKLPLRQGGT